MPISPDAWLQIGGALLGGRDLNQGMAGAAQALGRMRQLERQQEIEAEEREAREKERELRLEALRQQIEERGIRLEDLRRGEPVPSFDEARETETRRVLGGLSPAEYRAREEALAVGKTPLAPPAPDDPGGVGDLVRRARRAVDFTEEERDLALRSRRASAAAQERTASLPTDRSPKGGLTDSGRRVALDNEIRHHRKMLYEAALNPQVPYLDEQKRIAEAKLPELERAREELLNEIPKPKIRVGVIPPASELRALNMLRGGHRPQEVRDLLLEIYTEKSVDELFAKLRQ